MRDSLYGPIIYEAGLLLSGTADYWFRARRSRKLYANGYFLIVAAWTVVASFWIGFHLEAEFELLAAGALYLFAYMNSVALLKRGVSFSLLERLSARRQDRREGLEDLIDLNSRLEEMLGNRWIESISGRFVITRRGRRVLALYRLGRRLFASEAIG